ncbi:MAG: hypothetical protein ABI898_00630 [Sphingomonadales bacterium]
MLKVFASIAFAILAAFSGLMFFISDGGVDHTIENSKTILSQFEREASNGVSPAGNGPYQISVTSIENAQCDDTKFQNARKSAGDKVLLTAWRGEWTECYSPVSKISTLIFDRDAYSILGSATADRFVFGMVSFLSLCLALYLFATRSEPWFKTRTKPQPTP